MTFFRHQIRQAKWSRSSDAKRAVVGLLALGLRSVDELADLRGAVGDEAILEFLGGDVGLLELLGQAASPRTTEIDASVLSTAEVLPLLMPLSADQKSVLKGRELNLGRQTGGKDFTGRERVQLVPGALDVPIRDQGERGTCVAFAIIGAMEVRQIAQQSCDVRLSEQLLYYQCKELDGGSWPGTYIHLGVGIAHDTGVAEAEIWPYNPEQEADEGQGPPPDGAIEAAALHRLADFDQVERGDVDALVALLQAADAGPIVLGLPLFDSSIRNPTALRTGRLYMPLPGEEPRGWHAWSMVGLLRDDRARLWVVTRNSWGDRFAPESPVAPGHALVPIEYVRRYAIETFDLRLADSKSRVTRTLQLVGEATRVVVQAAGHALEVGLGGLLAAGHLAFLAVLLGASVYLVSPQRSVRTLNAVPVEVKPVSLRDLTLTSSSAATSDRRRLLRHVRTLIDEYFRDKTN